MKVFKNCYYFIHFSNSISALKLLPSAYFSYRHHFSFLISEGNKKGHPEESYSLFCILYLSAIVSEISNAQVSALELIWMGILKFLLNWINRATLTLSKQEVCTGLTPQCSGCGPLLVPLTADPGELTWSRCTGNFQPFISLLILAAIRAEQHRRVKVTLMCIGCDYSWGSAICREILLSPPGLLSFLCSSRGAAKD